MSTRDTHHRRRIAVALAHIQSYEPSSIFVDVNHHAPGVSAPDARFTYMKNPTVSVVILIRGRVISGNILLHEEHTRALAAFATMLESLEDRCFTVAMKHFMRCLERHAAKKGLS